MERAFALRRRCALLPRADDRPRLPLRNQLHHLLDDPLTVAPAILSPAMERLSCFASSASNFSLMGNPPPNPVSFPFAPITRWQGITIGMGFVPFAAPSVSPLIASLRAQSDIVVILQVYSMRVSPTLRFRRPSVLFPSASVGAAVQCNPLIGGLNRREKLPRQSVASLRAMGVCRHEAGPTPLRA
jgi:hypothetical protein